MGKKRAKQEDPPLADYWSSAARLAASRVRRGESPGSPLVCLATSYEFDAAFFEAELLPRFLGLRFDATEETPAMLIEREEALEKASVAVFVDHTRFDTKQTTLRWDQVAVRVPGGVQHAKMVVLAWEHLVRLIIGSANLTPAGYRRNRELFAAIDFRNDAGSAPRFLLRDALEIFRLATEWSQLAPHSRERHRESIDQVRSLLDRWKDMPQDFKQRDWPRARVLFTHPRTKDRGPRSTIDQLVDYGRWGWGRVSSIKVVTPFVSQADQNDAEEDPVIARLRDLPWRRECGGWLAVPEAVSAQEGNRAAVAVPASFGHAWNAAFAGYGGAGVVPVPLNDGTPEARHRQLHAKAIALESERREVLLIGSSNFTARGMGVEVYNLEANLVFVHAPKAGLLDALKETISPLDWNKDWHDTGAIAWAGHLEQPEDDPGTAGLPAFFAWASLSQKESLVRLGVDHTYPEPTDWNVLLPIEGDGLGKVLFTRPEQGRPTPQSELAAPMPERVRGRCLPVLLVKWLDEEGVWQGGILPIGVANKADLLPPEVLRGLGVEQIIAFLVTGKLPEGGNGDGPKRKKGKTPRGDALDPLRVVDVSSYPLYRVRRFGRAIRSMCERIRSAAGHAEAIRYRLLRDPFGPLNLARLVLAVDQRAAVSDSSPGGSVVESADPQVALSKEAAVSPLASPSAWVRALEQRVYLAAEILLAMGHLRDAMVRGLGGKLRQSIRQSFAEVLLELNRLIEDEIAQSDTPLPESLSDYLVAVREKSGLSAPPAEEEVESCP